MNDSQRYVTIEEASGALAVCIAGLGDPINLPPEGLAFIRQTLIDVDGFLVDLTRSQD